MELKELKQILENAPEGATHYGTESSYYRHDGVMDLDWWVNGGWQNERVLGDYEVTRSLSDIKTIVELMEEKDSKAITMLYGMGGYLTSMDKSITFGAKHWATPAVDIVSAIIDSNKLEGKCDFDLYVSPKVVFTKSAG